MNNIIKIIDLIRSKIETDHKIGNQSGGSGHLAFVSYSLHDLKINTQSNGNREITYWYTIYIETEFTYEPDNPPNACSYCKKITIDNHNEIISEEDTSMGKDDPAEWAAEKKRITGYLQDALLKIELKFGDNRAPIKYPPRFIEMFDNSSLRYICVVEPDLGDEEPPLIIETETLSNLFPNVVTTLKKRFNL